MYDDYDNDRDVLCFCWLLKYVDLVNTVLDPSSVPDPCVDDFFPAYLAAYNSV